MKLDLTNVTLAGVDCVDVQRLVEVSKICQKQIKFGAVKIFSSQKHQDENIVTIPHLSYEQISKFLIKNLKDYITTEYVIIIQHDGYILNPAAWSDMFFLFDYIGAPWWYTDGMNVGNGGFSLRSKKLCEILANDSRITQFHGEDFHICRTYRDILQQQGMKFAPECVARKFSFEGNPRSGLKWNGQFGFHNYSMSNLDNWPLYKNANIFSDFQFIKRFKEKTKARGKLIFRPEEIKPFIGFFTVTNRREQLEVSLKRSLLLIRLNGMQTVFSAFNNLFFFSDANEEIIQFETFRSIQVLILHRKAHNGLYNSTYFRKIGC